MEVNEMDKVGSVLVIGGGIERISYEYIPSYSRETPAMTNIGGASYG